MTIIQIKNMFIYTGIMLLDNQILMTSPDYFQEKSIKFFGKLGKSEFIQFPKIKYKYNTGKNFLKDYALFHDDF